MVTATLRTSDNIIVNEVGLRDGLQNQPHRVSLEDKLALIVRIAAAGVRYMEVTSFVSPKAVPQMADADELFRRLPVDDTMFYSALVPNLRGLARATAAGVGEIAVVLSATDTMNRRNINMSLEEATEESARTVAAAKQQGMRTKAYLAVSFTCPFEGEVAPSRVLGLLEKMRDAGADEIVIADTIGAAAPRAVKALLNEALRVVAPSTLSVHFHDTRGFALANVWAALESGVRKFDSSLGGLGGCPFSPGASGNLATEDLVQLADQCGLGSGIDMSRLRAAVSLAETLVKRPIGGRTRQWMEARDSRRAAEHSSKQSSNVSTTIN